MNPNCIQIKFKSMHLNDNKIYVNIVNSSGAISMSTISSAELGMGSQHLMQGDNQTKQALESFQFVGQKSEADAFVEFTIGQIRYDPITGWIADQATARNPPEKMYMTTIPKPMAIPV